ncbi:MAG: type III-B CRISPR module RAMP protein Cmr4 [Moraxella sp.]|nr:type III-B CRISPR module RAMP protein Cmr4 [Moraxella sp.]
MSKLMMNMVAQTSIHAGAGQAMSVIDLPIQREGHTMHPVIFGSSMKGALRFHAKKTTENDKILAVFGADSNADDTHAGAVMISDAKLLLLPVRSLNGYFKWVTCPALLRRYLKDCQRVGVKDVFELPDLSALKLDNVCVIDNKYGTVFLEEFALTTITAGLDKVSETLAKDFNLDKSALDSQLCVVSDDLFSYLAQNSTPVNAHIALDDNKTVKVGALWYEETLPPETVMYSVIQCTSSRKKGLDLNADEVAFILQSMFGNEPFLQVGGNETVGMGWFEVKFVQGVNS